MDVLLEEITVEVGAVLPLPLDPDMLPVLQLSDDVEGDGASLFLPPGGRVLER